MTKTKNRQHKPRNKKEDINFIDLTMINDFRERWNKINELRDEKEEVFVQLQHGKYIGIVPWKDIDNLFEWESD